MSNVHIFDNPLRYTEFVDHLQIGQGAITALHGKQFDNIKRLLARKNDLPHFLENARIGGLTFRDVNKDNWPSISSNGNARFIDEAQIRVYLLDFLLKELKDQGTPVLEECNCYRRRHKGKPKRADYFVKIYDRWVPVEAKLNILAERDVLGQVKEYINIKSFVPTRGHTEARSSMRPAPPFVWS